MTIHEMPRGHRETSRPPKPSPWREQLDSQIMGIEAREIHWLVEEPVFLAK